MLGLMLGVGVWGGGSKSTSKISTPGSDLLNGSSYLYVPQVAIIFCVNYNGGCVIFHLETEEARMPSLEK